MPVDDNSMDPIADILRQYKIKGPWEAILGRGVGNRIYATPDVVIRIAADHRDSLSDAYTESVAAPVARAAGVQTPQLIAFDDSRRLVNRPFSLWERVHGETLGVFETDPAKMPNTWTALGRQLGLLHTAIKDCPDPNHYLDEQTREMGHREYLKQLADRQQIDQATYSQIAELIDALSAAIDVDSHCCFLHGDLHANNVMCSAEDTLLAIIDWGDAGWGDPVLDFAAMPLETLPFVLKGYTTQAPDLLGPQPEARIVWDKLYLAMKAALRQPGVRLPIDPLWDFLRHGISEK